MPIWGSDIHPIAALVPSADGKSIHATGWYWANSKHSHGHHFDSVALPDYNAVEGTYNAKINAETGKGEYVLHSGGIGKTRVYDAVGNANGDIFMVGYTQSAVLDWGGTLQTKIIEEGDDQNDDVVSIIWYVSFCIIDKNDTLIIFCMIHPQKKGTAFQMGKVSSNTKEYQFFAVKLAATAPSMLQCVESCALEGGIANSVVKSGSCLIDNVCYEKGATAEIFGRPCLVCDPDGPGGSTGWSPAATVGDLVCFIDDVCYDEGDFLTYRESRSVLHTSLCQHCSPKDDSFGWFVNADDFMLVPDMEPPNDCLNKTNESTGDDEMTDNIFSAGEETMSVRSPPLSKQILHSYMSK